MSMRALCFFFFFFNDPAPTEIYTLPLPDALPISDHDGQVGHARLDTGSTADRTDRLAARRGVGRRLPQAANPEHVVVLAGLLVIGKLAFQPRRLGEHVGVCAAAQDTAPQDTRLEQTDA